MPLEEFLLNMYIYFPNFFRKVITMMGNFFPCAFSKKMNFLDISATCNDLWAVKKAFQLTPLYQEAVL
ncbi:hypothetical protein Scep_024024 [Stephania cephalantha]|uniref:Uncharacterized protein n=1 Tax=Stephania cephalantha TaxID=152367 RepID=A0AAP0EWF5_9MAGN